MPLPIRLVAAIAVCAPGLALAQSLQAPSASQTAPAQADLLNTHEFAAIQAALDNNADLVEASVSQLLADRGQPDLPGSAAWHISMGLQLMQVVRQTPQEGNGRSTILSGLAHRAEAHVQQGDTLASSSVQHASAKALLGLLNERYFGNMSAAVAYYRAAVALDPAHTLAQRSADRLERSEARLHQRLAERGVTQ